MLKRPLAFAVIAVVLSLGANFVVAGIPAGGFLPASEPTQILNNIALGAMLAKEIIMAEAQLAMLDDMGTQGQFLDAVPPSVIVDDIVTLAGALNTAAGLANDMGTLDMQFNAAYVPWDPTQAVYFDAYNGWYTSTMTAILGTLTRSSINVNQILTEQGLHQQLDFLAATTTGRNQAVQLGNIIGLQVWGAIRRLNTIMVAQVNAESSYFGYQLQQDLAKQVAANNALMPVDRDADHRQCPGPACPGLVF